MADAKRWSAVLCVMRPADNSKRSRDKVPPDHGRAGGYRRRTGSFATLTADVTSLEGAMSMLGATAPQAAIGMAALGLASRPWRQRAAGCRRSRRRFSAWRRIRHVGCHNAGVAA